MRLILNSITVLALTLNIACLNATVGHGHAATPVNPAAYPSRPIRLLTTEPGSGTNVVARLLAQELSLKLGQPVIVDNRGIAAVEIVAHAQADGHTLLVYTSPMWLLSFMRGKVAWDVTRDFAPISLTSRQPSVLAVHPQLAVNSVLELIALTRAKPGALNYGSGTAGAPSHLSAELFNSLAGTRITRIPFKGGGPALTALMAREVQLGFGVPAAVLPLARSGRLKALAVTSAEQSPLAPGLATIADSGLPQYEATAIAGFFVPAGTREPIIRILNTEAVRILSAHDTQERLLNAGVEGVSSSPQQLAAAVQHDRVKWGKVIGEAAISD